MREFTLILDDSNYYKDYSELFDYLYTLNGIIDVVITTDDKTTVYTKYNEELINDEIIKYEILAFLNLLNYPSIYGFDRHPKEYKTFTLDCHICCDFCFGNIMYDLIETKGILKAESDFYEKYWGDTRDNRYTVTVYYDPKIISNKKLAEIKKELEVYA